MSKVWFCIIPYCSSVCPLLGRSCEDQIKTLQLLEWIKPLSNFLREGYIQPALRSYYSRIREQGDGNAIWVNSSLPSSTIAKKNNVKPKVWLYLYFKLKHLKEAFLCTRFVTKFKKSQKSCELTPCKSLSGTFKNCLVNQSQMVDIHSREEL